MESAVTQHSPKPSLDGTNTTEEENTRGSLDSAGIRPASSSSSQLAETALSSLRKTLVLQRPASPLTTSGAKSLENQPRPRTTLEDRLKAKFAIGEASNGTSPSQSTRSTPSTTPVPVVEHPLSPVPPEPQPTSSSEDVQILSPKSVPLPDSPVTLLAIASPNPRLAAASHPLASIESNSPSALDLDAPDSNGHDETPLLDPVWANSLEVLAHDGFSLTLADETAVNVEPDEASIVADAPAEDSTSSDTPSLDRPSEMNDPEPAAIAEPVSTETRQQPPPLLAREEPAPTSSPTVDDPASSPPDATETSVPEEITAQATEAQNDISATPSPTVPEDVVSGHDISSVHDDHPCSVFVPEDPIVEPNALPVIETSDFEALQKRLKLVEQRFTGRSQYFICTFQYH